MIKLIDKQTILKNGKLIPLTNKAFETLKVDGINRENVTANKKGTMAYKILTAHSIGGESDNLKIKFDALASHDITYVGIIQTAKASGLEKFPLSYTLTNCHNSLCAVGGTINEDDHVFGLSAAIKYGGNFVPPHVAVIHQYMREMEAKTGRMILGSDSHTRYGALGTMAIGEGGPELVKQILNKTYDIKMPKITAVYLKGKVQRGVGPQDVALALIGKVFKNAFVKNSVLEFIGPGIKNLSVEFRNGIDVMTTETTCLSSIWETDEKVEKYYAVHGRIGDYKKIAPEENAVYDNAVIIDLSKVEPMIALPFHPSNAYTIREFKENMEDILAGVEAEGQKLLKNGEFKLRDKIVNGELYVTQGVIAGCSGGTYENIAEASNILKGGNTGDGEFALSVYPASLPVYKDLMDKGYLSQVIKAGAIVKTAFCGPCFGAGDVPANNGLSIRHTTRNFESREGSKPGNGQLSCVALMDSRSIAATALNGGKLTSATEIDYSNKIKPYFFDESIYDKKVFKGVNKGDTSKELKYGPNIADWPTIDPLKKDLLLKVVSVIHDPVTTTDELIPSGETSSYRSNPLKLAEFALSRKDPQYVGRAKEVKAEYENLKKGELNEEVKLVASELGLDISDLTYGSVVCANKPGDGSAREQAASCQRVLGGSANISVEYATKRYRSNLINWGMLPLLTKKLDFEVGDYVIVKGVREFVESGASEIGATKVSVKDGKANIKEITLSMDSLTPDEKQIILKGCLINFYSNK